jgi:hypothetical protein
MNRILLLLMLMGMGLATSAQYVYTIKADSVKITNSCDTAELIIENHTQTVPGFLYNKGRGRTEFRRGAFKLNDSVYIIGADTLKVNTGLANNGLSVAGKAVQLGQDVGQTGGPAALLVDREIPTAGFNLSLSGGGSLLVNSNKKVGAEKLQVTNGISVLDNIDTGSFTINKSANTASIKFNSVSSYSPTLTFVDNKGFVFGGDGQTTPLSINSLISIYPKDLYDAYDPLINIQPFSADFLMRVIGAKNLSSGISAGCGLHFQNDVNKTLQLYIAGSGASNLNGGPDASVLWSNSNNGLRLTSNSNSTSAGIYFTTEGASNGNIKGFINNTGNWMLLTGTSINADNGAKLQVSGNETISGNLGIGGITSIGAKMHLGAGTATAGTAPIKLTAGTVLATPEDGAIEFDGSDLYFTENSTRYKLSKTLTGQLTTSFGGPSLSAYNSVTTTLSVAGAQPGDVVNVSANSGVVNPSSIIITAYVTSANTVTLQAYNASNSTVTIATDTYKVRVIK